MNKKPMKLAFIGGSVNSAIGYTHLIASQMDHRFILEAACFSRDKHINRITAKKWGVTHKHLYDDWNKLLLEEKNNIDALVILTPTPLHYEIAMKALDIGYPVICEKALTSSFEKGKKICNKTKETNGFLAVTHNYTGYPMLRELQHMISEKKLGKIFKINIEMPQESFARLDKKGIKPKPQEWRLKDEEIPGISLDLGAHLQHMIYFLTKENPIKIIADQNSFGWFSDIVDDVVCLAKYQSGMRSQMWYSKSAIGNRNGLKVDVYGSKGSASWYQMEPEELKFNTINGERIILDRASTVEIANKLRYNRFKAGHPSGFIEAFANLYCDIADKLELYKKGKNNYTEWSYSASQATKGLKIFEMMKQSSSQDKWITV